MNRSVTLNIISLYVIKVSKWLMLTMPILFLFYRENGLGARDLFVLKAAYSAAIVLMEVPSGYFGDRWGRKRSLVLGSVLGFAGFFLYCISHGFYGFLACEIILGIGQSFISGSDSALLYDTLVSGGRRDAYLKTEGRLISVGNFAEALAAPLGVLLAGAGMRWPFYVQAGVALLAVPAALCLYEPDGAPSGGTQTPVRPFRAIVRYALVESPVLKWNIVFSSVMGTATLTMAWFVQPYLVHLSVPLALYAVVIPLLNVSTGMVSMHAHRLERRLGLPMTLVFICISIVSGYLAMGGCTSMWGLVCLLIFYMCRGVATPVLRNAINEITPSEIRATVLSIRSLTIRLSFVLLGPVLGWYTDTAGVPATLFAGGGFFLVTGGVSVLMLIRILHHGFPAKAAGKIPA